jgi:dethiobiotin synthetase
MKDKIVQENIFITAIGTDCGKTLVSAILVEALQANYWKPIQAGYPTDTETVKSLISNPDATFFPSAYSLKKPASPHDAAQEENIEINLENIILPETSKTLIIEGAGGVLVPLNQNDFVIDMAQKWQMEVVLVANLYLGSINHTLLTINELKRRNIKVKGIIFNGEPNEASEQIILKHSQYKCLLRIQPEKQIDKTVVLKYAKQIQL